MNGIEFNGRRFEVTSDRKGEVKYEVFYSLLTKRWLCTCPDFMYRKYEQNRYCKHIRKVLNALDTLPTEDLEKLKKRGIV